MVERFSGFVIRHRKAMLLIFFAATVICAVLQSGVTINYKIADYLPEDAPSTHALSVMSEEFSTAAPNARVMIRDVTIPEALAYKASLAKINGITEILWLDDLLDLSIPLSALDQGTVETYYKNGNAIFSIVVTESMESPVMASIYEIIGDQGAIAGEAAGSATYQGLSVKEATKAFCFLIPAILLILTVSTTSWIEPLLFLTSIGIAVIINMGTNRIFPSVSYITSAISPILQMAVSLDYAVFLLNSFEKHRAKTPNVETAMKEAMIESFPAVLASALTTLFGFLALTVMRFQLGGDLGFNLAKGICFSLIGSMVFLPALTLCSFRWIDRTRHRRLMPSFEKPAKWILRFRAPAVILILICVVPAFLAQRQDAFLYGTGDLDRQTRPGQDEQAILDAFGQSNPMVVLVPRGDPEREAALSQDLEALPHVSSVISYAKSVGVSIPTSYLDQAVLDQFYSAHYARIVLYASTSAESDDAFSLVQEVRALSQSCYGEDALVLGQSVSLYDIASVIDTDNRTVNLLAIAAIGLVLLLTFRSLMLPVVLVLTIETAIWINLAAPYFMNSKLCFVGYLVICSVQLGATVDYAILYTEHYLKNRQLLLPLEAAEHSASETMGSILVSGSILSIAGYLVGIVSTNRIVYEIGTLIGRGALLSLLFVLLFLPAALSFCDRWVEKTTKNVHFYHEEMKHL